MESNFEYVKTLYENECQRIVKCKDIKNNQVYIYNTIINSNLIKLIDTNILSSIKSNILKVSKSADRIYIVSTPYDGESQAMLKDYIMNNNLTLRSQFNLAEQLVRLFIDIYSTSDLLQYKIINYDNISVDKEENIICNGYLKFRDEFDLSDNFTYKSIGNMIHFIFSKEEIDDYDISENIPPDVLKIIVKCLTRDYFHPKDLLNELINCPIYGIINCDSNNPTTISRLSLINKNVSENETITLKTNNSIGMNSIDPSKRYEDEVINDKAIEKKRSNYDNNSKNSSILNNPVLGKSIYDGINKVKTSNKINDINNNTEDVNNKLINDNIISDSDKLINDNIISDSDKLINDKLINDNIISDSDKLINDNIISDSDKLINDNIVSDSDKLINDNIISDSDKLINDNIVSDSNKLINDNIVSDSDKQDNKDLKKENIIDIYFNKKGSYEDKLLNGQKKPKYLKTIVITAAILLVCGLCWFLCKTFILDKDKETAKDNDGNETVHTGDKPDSDSDKPEDDKEDEDNKDDEELGYSKEVNNYLNDDIISKYNYFGPVAKEVKSDYYEGKTSLLIDNKDEESKKVLFAIIDFTNENYSYLLNKQFQMSAAFKSKKDTNIKLITELYSGDKLIERKVDNFDVSNDLWTVRTTNRKVLGANRINLYAQIEGGNSLWIDTVKAEVIK